SDCRIRQSRIRQRQEHPGSRADRCPHPVAAYSDDRFRVHSRMRSVMAGVRLWRRLTPGPGYCCDRRHAGRDFDRHFPDPCHLRCDRNACGALQAIASGSGHRTNGDRRRRSLMRRVAALTAAFLLMGLAGCTVGPNYKRPVVNVPTTYRGEPPPGQSAAAIAASLGDEKWWAVFQDQELQKLIRTALERNYDVRIAATRVVQAQAQLGITRADQFPSISGGAGVSGTRSPAVPGVFNGYQYLADTLNLSASWNLDFWGRYRRATEAARANLLGSEWGRRAVLSTVVANVAAAYFQLRELDLELSIAQGTLASRQQSLKLTETLANGGATSMLDVRQAQQLVETAAEAIPETEREIQTQENQISIYLGENPAGIPRGRALTEQPLLPSIPAGLPSSLL